MVCQTVGGDIDAKLVKKLVSLRAVLFSKMNVKLFYDLTKEGFCCVNYDGMDCKIECHIDTLDGEYVLQTSFPLKWKIYITKDD